MRAAADPGRVRRVGHARFVPLCCVLESSTCMRIRSIKRPRKNDRTLKGTTENYLVLQKIFDVCIKLQLVFESVTFLGHLLRTAAGEDLTLVLGICFPIRDGKLGCWSSSAAPHVLSRFYVFIK